MSSKERPRLVQSIYNAIGCDAFNIGERDLALGVEFLKELENTSSFPFISANLTDASGKPIFRRYVIKRVGDLRIGILGLIGDTADILKAVKKSTGGTLMPQDPFKAAEAVVRELEGKTDMIIALTHQGMGRDWILLKRVKGIHLVAGGHDKQWLKVPHRVDASVIVQAGEKGQYAGLISGVVTQEGFHLKQNELTPLDASVPDDKEIRDVVAKHEKRMAEQYGPSGKTESSLSSERCRKCHEREYKTWSGTKHAVAYEALTRKNSRYDPECLRCHTTRFEEQGGFNMRSYPMGLINVQCEACHGEAALHAENKGPVPMKQPSRETCLQCHQLDRSPAFDRDYYRYTELILHK